jgi:hypothetical protein
MIEHNRCTNPCRALGVLLVLALSACGGGSGGAASGPVTVSGQVTFQLVPGNATGIGLDYSAMTDAPARGVGVDAVSTQDRTTVLASATTDDSGHYALSVARNTGLYVRARAEMQSSGTIVWHYRVLDNTSSNALYAIVGADFNSGSADSVHNLSAASGWDGSAYSGARAAAPFALLDDLYRASSLVSAGLSSLTFPDLDVFWSKNNRPAAPFDAASGDIETTGFFPPPANSSANPAIYVLGDEGVDTDEYDSSVITHEWGHYLQYSFSRNDSMGGDHSVADRLDLRMAFSEGWGNAFSGMATGRSIYQDSQGPQQAGGDCLALTNPAADNCAEPSNTGWYNEGSVQHVLYGLFAPSGSSSAALGLGIAPIFTVLQNEMKSTRALTSIFPFAAALKTRNPGAANGVDTLLNSENIAVGAPAFDDYGTGESNDGGDPTSLPIYASISAPGSAANVCSEALFGSFNKLGVRKFLKLSLAADRSVTISATGSASSDPQLRLYGAGLQQGTESHTPGTDTLSAALSAGDYIIEVYEYGNTLPTPVGTTCFTLTVN